MVDIAACKRAALFYIMVSCLRAGTASDSPRPRHRAYRPSTARRDASLRGMLAETPAHLGHRCRRRRRPLFILRCIRLRLRCIQTRTSPRRTTRGVPSDRGHHGSELSLMPCSWKGKDGRVITPLVTFCSPGRASDEKQSIPRTRSKKA